MSTQDSPFAGASRARGYREDAVAPAVRPVPEPPAAEAAEPPAPVVLEVTQPHDVDAAPAPAIGWGDLDAESELTTPATPVGAIATTGIRGVVVRATAGLVKLAPSAAERAELERTHAAAEDERVIRQATWTRAVGVLVANRKGGVGKTPTALGTGGVLAAIRGGSVAIVEVSDDPGALTFRAEGSPSLGLGELLRDIDKIVSAGQLAGYTAPQTSFASVIGTVGRRGRLTRDDVVGVARLVDEFYGIRVMDSGNQPTSAAFQGALETADVLVVPILNAGDAALEAIDLLEYLHEQGGHSAELARNAIIVRLTDGRPELPHVVERITRLIDRAKPAAVFEIPCDAHIAERGQITIGKLSPSTRTAYTHLAAGVVNVLKTTVK